MRIIDDLDYQSTQQATPVSTTGELINARFSNSLVGNFSQSREAELELRDAKVSTTQGGDETLFGYMFGPSLYERDNSNVKENKVLSRDEAMSRAKAAGVKVDIPADGMREAAVDILIKRRTEEAKREFVFSSAEKNFTNTVAGFAGDFAGMMVDPFNVAAAFVPVVGEARYGAWLARAGGLLERTAIRGGVGAAEGFVGSVALEPFILSNRQALQDDYDIYDSMNNIAAGTFFGSALHAGAGMFGDAYHGYKGTSPEWVKYREKVKAGDTTGKPPVLSELDIKTAKQQIELMDALSEVSLPRTGIEAANVIDARIAGLREASARVLDQPTIAALRSEQDELALLLTDVNRIERERAAGNVVKQRDGVLDTLSPEEIKLATDRLAEIKVSLEQHKLGLDSAKSLRELEEKLGKIDLDSDLIALSEKINPSNRKYYELRESKELTPENKKALESDPYRDVRPIMAQLTPETQARMFRAVIAQVADGRLPDVTAAMLSDPKLASLPGVKEAVIANAKANLAEPANITNKLARDAETRYAEVKSTGDIDKDSELLLHEQSSFNDYLARTGLAEDADVMKVIDREIKAEDMEVSKAKSQADAAKQAAACLAGAL